MGVISLGNGVWPYIIEIPNDNDLKKNQSLFILSLISKSIHSFGDNKKLRGRQFMAGAGA